MEGKQLDTNRFLIAALRNELKYGVMSLDPVWRVISWSLNAAYEGTFPEHDAWGKPLTGDRARMAGKPLCGGPWALTQFRTALQNVGVIRIQKIKYTQQGPYAILYIKLNIRC